MGRPSEREPPQNGLPPETTAAPPLSDQPVVAPSKVPPATGTYCALSMPRGEDGAGARRRRARRGRDGIRGLRGSRNQQDRQRGGSLGQRSCGARSSKHQDSCPLIANPFTVLVVPLGDKPEPYGRMIGCHPSTRPVAQGVDRDKSAALRPIHMGMSREQRTELTAAAGFVLVAVALALWAPETRDFSAAAGAAARAALRRAARHRVRRRRRPHAPAAARLRADAAAPAAAVRAAARGIRAGRATAAAHRLAAIGRGQAPDPVPGRCLVRDRARRRARVRRPRAGPPPAPSRWRCSHNSAAMRWSPRAACASACRSVPGPSAASSPGCISSTCSWPRSACSPRWPGAQHPLQVALVMPLAGLLVIFARERRGRIENALELGPPGRRGAGAAARRCCATRRTPSRSSGATGSCTA